MTSPAVFWEETISHRGHGKCKGPEEGVYPEYSGSSKEAVAAGAKGQHQEVRSERQQRANATGLWKPL